MEDVKTIRTFCDKHWNDELTRETIYNFLIDIAKKESENTAVRSRFPFDKLFSGKTLKEFDWETYIKGITMQEFKGRCSVVKIFTNFLFCLIDNGLYCGDYLDEINENKNAWKLLLEMDIRDIAKRIPSEFKPWNLIIVPEADKRLNKKFDLCFAPGLSKSLCKIIDDYYNELNVIYNPRIKEFYDTLMFLSFNDSLEGIEINDFEDFNEDIFLKQFYYYINHGWKIEKNLGFLLKFHIYVQYKLGEDKAKKRYPHYDIDILKYNIIMSCINEGYKIVNYSIYDEPKFASKVLLKNNNMDLKGTATKDSLLLIDMSEIKSIEFQKMIFDFIWKEISTTYGEKRQVFYSLKNFAIFLELQKQVFITKDNISINIEDITAFRVELAKKNISDGQINRQYNTIKKFLNYLEKNEIFKAEPLVYELLKHKEAEHSKGCKEAFTKEEISNIIEAIKKDAENQTKVTRADLYQLYLYAFSIFSLTEMRISSVFALTTDCVKETLNHKGFQEYKVLVKDKVSGTEMDEYNITKYVKEIIDEVIEYTKKYREYCIGGISNSLFICQNEYRGGISQLKYTSFSDYFSELLKKNGIRKLPLGAVRNYYMQNVSKYVSENGHDEKLIEKLSGHSINVHINHYDDIDIKTFCQNHYNIEIGDIYLKGKIEEQNILPKENTVANGCGHCECDKCILNGKLDCFMCKHFITTLDCIPYYKQRINDLDLQIYSQKIEHEKEFLLTKKRLLVAYLEQLMELEAKVNAQ